MRLLKNNKTIYVVITILVLICSILSYKLLLNNNQKDTALIGINQYVIDDVDTSFASDFMDSSHLLKMVDLDCSKNISGKIIKLSTYIKQKDEIIINIGSYEIEKLFITNNNNEITYDNDLIDRQIKILLSNIELIIHQIKAINARCYLYLCKLNSPFEKDYFEIISIYNKINNNLNEIAQINNVTLI